MPSCFQVLCAEFQQRNLGFSIADEEVSWVIQFGDSVATSSRQVFVAWRGILAVTMIVGMGLQLAEDFAYQNSDWYLVYLTNWAIVVHIAHLLVSWIVAISIMLINPDQTIPQPLHTKFVWALRSISQPAAFIVTIAFWALVFDGILTLPSFWAHAVNSLVVLLDVFSSRYQIRLVHYVYVLAFGASFVIWSVIHFVANVGTGPGGSRYIYKVLDWSEGKTSMAIITVLLVLFILAPICTAAVWSFCLLRNVVCPLRLVPVATSRKEGRTSTESVAPV